MLNILIVVKQCFTKVTDKNFLNFFKKNFLKKLKNLPNYAEKLAV